MEIFDDDLRKFESDGAAMLLPAVEEGYVENAGVRIWQASFGAGPAVILMHDGLGHNGPISSTRPCLHSSPGY